jgi:DNA-binding IclR family transcriptional regulator
MLGRADLILSLFDNRHHTLSLAGLAARAGLPRTTSYRVAEQMVRLGWLTRTQGRYGIGHRLFELASLAPIQHQLREAALPYMQDLYEVTHETVHLAVRDELEVLYVDKISGHRRSTYASRVGGRQPLHSTAVGKVLLASAEPGLLTRVIEAGLIRYTETTITTADRLRQELAVVLRDGVAFDRGENEADIVCIAAPLVFSDGEHAAVSVTALSSRIHPERLVYALRVAAFGIMRSLARDQADNDKMSAELGLPVPVLKSVANVHEEP